MEGLFFAFGIIKHSQNKSTKKADTETRRGLLQTYSHTDFRSQNCLMIQKNMSLYVMLVKTPLHNEAGA
jgi:hypothetical protein